MMECVAEAFFIPFGMPLEVTDYSVVAVTQIATHLTDTHRQVGLPDVATIKAEEESKFPMFRSNKKWAQQQVQTEFMSFQTPPL